MPNRGPSASGEGHGGEKEIVTAFEETIVQGPTGPLILSNRVGASQSYDLRSIDRHVTVPTILAPPTTSHRSRKEKLVLRSFSTEVEDGMMDFTEPTIVPSDDYDEIAQSGRRASRTRRTASAPDPARKSSTACLSQVRESDISFSGAPESQDPNPVVPVLASDEIEIEVLDDVAPSPPPNRKPKSKGKPVNSSSKTKVATPNNTSRGKNTTPKGSSSKTKADKDVSVNSPKNKAATPSKEKGKSSNGKGRDINGSSKGKTKTPKASPAPAPEKKLVSTPEKVYEKKPVRRKLDYSSPASSLVNNERLKKVSVVNTGPGLYPLNPFKAALKKPFKSIPKGPSVPKKPFVSPEQIKRVVKPERSATPNKQEASPLPKVLVKWSLKRKFSSVIHSYLKHCQKSGSKPPNLGPDAIQIDVTKTKPSDFWSVSHPPKKKKRMSEGCEEGGDPFKEQQEQDLLHYVIGVACLEQLVDSGTTVALPQIYYKMVERLSECFSNGKENWTQLMDYARKLVKQNRHREIDMLIQDRAHKIPSKEKDDNKTVFDVEGAFRPIFPITAVIEDKPTVSYPRITEEELSIYKSLVDAAENDFECGEDEYVFAQIFLNLMETELEIVSGRKKQLKVGLGSGREARGLKPLRRIVAKIIPVDYEEPQNSHGLFIPLDVFAERFLKSSENRLLDLHRRTLRNGKTVPLKQVNVPELKTIVKKFVTPPKPVAKSVPALPPLRPAAPLSLIRPYTGKTATSVNKDDVMRLRSGKQIPYEPLDTAQLLRPALKLNIHPESEADSESGSPVKGSSPGDDYTIQVEAKLSRLQEMGMGEDMFFLDLSQPDAIPPPSSRKPQKLEAGRCVTRGRFPPLPVFNPSSPGVNHWSPPSSPSSSSSSPLSSSSVHSEYTFKPIQPQPLSSRIVESGSTIRFGKIMEELKGADTFTWGRHDFSSAFLPGDQPGGAEQRASPSSPCSKKRYSRHRHAKICPPFDNNHCSYETHFCGHPRAVGSRFCLEHADEGATMNFARCKYVKGSRECGRYIPKSQSQSVFCDMHAIAIAKARQKKLKNPKPQDPTLLFVKHMRCNLDRVQGKLMEPDEHGQFRVREELWEDEREALNDSSDSESDDGFSVADYADDQQDNDSDLDEEDDPPAEDQLDYGLLKHAGYYTVSEVAEIYRHYLAQLQKLYIREFDCIKREYKYGKKEYVKALKRLKRHKRRFTTDPKYLSFDQNEFYSEDYIQNQIKSRLKTRAYLKNKRITGRRAVLRLQVMKKRQELIEVSKAAEEDPETREPSNDDIEEDEIDVRFHKRKLKLSKLQICCAVNRNGIRCKDMGIPLSKFCRNHITQDKNQKLFSTCNQFFGPDSEDTCKVTVLSELEKFGCPLHNLPIPVKEAPEGDEKKPEEEEELEKLLEEAESSSPSPSSSLSSNSSETDSDDDMVREMEQLVGDELVDMDHFWENVNYLMKKGVDETDTEESDDTDEEESSVPPEEIVKK